MVSMLRARRALSLVVVATVAGLAGVTPAHAAVPPTATGMWQVQGQVKAVVNTGSVIYVGGLFTQLLPPAGDTTSTPVLRNNVAAFSASTGAPLEWAPEADGEVAALAASPDGSSIYLTGSFRSLGATPVPRTRLAAVDADKGAPTSWAPALSAPGKALSLSTDGSRLFVGGAFLKANGQVRKHLAAYSTGTGELDPWAPDPDGTATFHKGVLVPSAVNSLASGSDGNVYVGGVFTSIGGFDRTNGASVNAVTGLVQPFAPALSDVVLNVNVAQDATLAFFSGRGPGGFAGAWTTGTGTRKWLRKFDGDVQASVVTSGLLYLGGHFDFITKFNATVTSEERHHLAAVDPTTGAADPTWTPRANTATGVFALSYAAGRLAAGGDFTRINYKVQQGIAQFVEAPAPA